MASNKIEAAQSALSREEWEKVYLAVKLIVEEQRKGQTSVEANANLKVVTDDNRNEIEYEQVIVNHANKEKKEWEDLMSKVFPFTIEP